MADDSVLAFEEAAVPLRTVADQPKGQIFTHAELDSVFTNVELIIAVNEAFLRELEDELARCGGDYSTVAFGEIIQRGAKQFKGCYTRYVTNYDAAEGLLGKLSGEQTRWVETKKTLRDQLKALPPARTLRG